MSESKMAILYYTRTGNTESIAQMLRDGLSARNVVVDMIKIEVEGEVNLRRIGRMAKEQEISFLNTTFDLSDYDVIVMGTPIWGGGVPTPFTSYLKRAGDGWVGHVALFLTGMRKVRKNDSIIGPIEQEIRELGFERIEARMILKFRRGKLVEGEDSIPGFLDALVNIDRT